MTIIYAHGTIPGRDGEGPIAVLKDDTHLSRWIEEDRRLDADRAGLHKLALPYIPEGGVVVDAGASLGDHTAFYAQKASVVHAFEPQAESFQCLAHNCAHLANVKAINCALSDYAGQACIAKQFNVGGSGISPKGDPIKTIALDSLGISPAFIKWDVEGHEVRALRGARMTIMRCRPVMVLEVHARGLAAAGFTIHDLWAELQWLEYVRCKDIRTGAPFNPNDGKPEYDILCTP